MSDQSISVRASSRSQNLLLFILPVVVLGLFAASLFVSFLGDQASEIAKLIGSIEDSCKALYVGDSPAAGAAGQAGTTVTICGAYAFKVLLFYALTAVWCAVGFVVTIYLASSMRFRAIRLFVAALVTLALPTLIMFKYFISGQYAKYVKIEFREEAIVPDITYLGFPWFSAIVVGLVALSLLSMVVATAWRKELPTFAKVIPVLFWVVVLTFVGLAILFAVHPRNLYDMIGSINIIVLYITLLYVFLAGLFYYSRKTGYPVAALFFIYLVVINGIGINNNYYVEADPMPEPAVKGEQQFLKWLKSRSDFEAYRSKGRPYPVYIIASSGGGMYAAMRTSYLLDVIQSKCPAFMQHTFAVSSVSGGALGALIFGAKQAYELPKIAKPCLFQEPSQPPAPSDALNLPVSKAKDRSELDSPILDAFYGRDVVSAIVGGGLFPEMLQRVWPWPIERLSRSNAFRKALRENWRLAVRENASTQARAQKKDGGCQLGTFLTTCNIANYWDYKGDFPLQIYNATWVDAGAPIVLSNIDPQYYFNVGVAGAVNVRNSSLKLLDGASLSARFPVALPAGFIASFGAVREMRLVDGGYFDNSGLIAALSVREEIRRIVADTENGIAGQVEVHLVFLGEQYDAIGRRLSVSSPSSLAGEELASWWSFGWLNRKGGEIGAHATALFKARDQRSLWTMQMMRRHESDIMFFTWLVSDETPNTKQADCAEIPLAWYLAPCTQHELKLRLRDSVEHNPFETTKLQSQLITP